MIFVNYIQGIGIWKTWRDLKGLAAGFFFFSVWGIILIYSNIFQIELWGQEIKLLTTGSGVFNVWLILLNTLNQCSFSYTKILDKLKVCTAKAAKLLWQTTRPLVIVFGLCYVCKRNWFTFSEFCIHYNMWEFNPEKLGLKQEFFLTLLHKFNSSHLKWVLHI